MLSAFALMVGLFAIYKGTKDLAKERRLIHELEILRSLGQLVDARVPISLNHPVPALTNPSESKLFRVFYPLRYHLLLLPGSDDLPLTRAVVDARPSRDARLAFARRYPEEDDSGSTRRLEAVQYDGTTRRELDEAIDRRLTVSPSWWRRLLGGRCL